MPNWKKFFSGAEEVAMAGAKNVDAVCVSAKKMSASRLFLGRVIV